MLPFVGLVVLATGAMLIGVQFGRARRPPKNHRLELTVVNVSQGEAAWLRTPGGSVILIGCGPPETAERVVQSLRRGGVREIALLALPYPYREALGGAQTILSEMPVRAVLEAGYPKEDAPPINQFQADLRSYLAERMIPVTYGHAGEQIPLPGASHQPEARVEILAPPEPMLPVAPAAANNSLVLRVVWGDTAFLFAGGIENAGENSLLSRSADLSAGWLRVARFGTRQATSAEFLRRVSPEIAVISVGTGNSGGYPHQETLDALAATGATIFRTDQIAQPELRFFSDGARISPEP